MFSIYNSLICFLLPLICRQGFDVRIKHHIQTDRAAADYTSMSDSEASTTHDVIRPGNTGKKKTKTVQVYIYIN